MAQLPSTMNMGINTNIFRKRSTLSGKNSFRKSSILSQASSMAYHKRMEIMNNLQSEDIQNPIDSLQLSYTSNNRDIEKDKLVSEVTNNSL